MCFKKINVTWIHYLLLSAYFDDLYVYDPFLMAWADLTAVLSSTPPSPRYAHGFASESAGGRLYVHGGMSQSGENVGLGHAYTCAAGICFLVSLSEQSYRRKVDYVATG